MAKTTPVARPANPQAYTTGRRTALGPPAPRRGFVNTPGGINFETGGDYQKAKGLIPNTAAALTNAPAAPPVTDPFHAYLASFETSLGASRARLDQMLNQSLTSMQSRRDQQAGIAAALPGEIQKYYGNASEALGNAQKVATSALPDDVKNSVGAYATPLNAALAQDKGGYQSTKPYIDLAGAANAASGEAALRQQHMAGMNELDMQEQQNRQQIAMFNAQQQNETQRANQEYRMQADPNSPDKAWEREKMALQHGYGQVDDAAKMAVQQDLAAQEKGYNSWQEMQSLPQDADYQYALAQLQGRPSPGGNVAWNNKGGKNRLKPLKGLLKSPNGAMKLKHMVDQGLITPQEYLEAQGIDKSYQPA